MKKKWGSILCLIMLMVIMSGSFCSAAGLSIVGTTPEEGYNKLTPINVAVKLEFNENMCSKEAQDANKDCFKLVGPKGKTVEVIPLYNEKRYPNEIWLQVDAKLKDASDYTLTVSGDTRSSDGNTLGEDFTLNFSMRDTSKDGKINALMMALMFGAMMFFSIMDTKKKAKEAAEKDKKAAEENKVNPYKEARRTGKSVEEIVAKDQKQKERETKRAHRKAVVGGIFNKEKEEEEELPDGWYRVKGPKPIATAGGKLPAYILEKREAQKKAAEEEAARKAKAREQKSKGSKQQQKKKKK